MVTKAQVLIDTCLDPMTTNRLSTPLNSLQLAKQGDPRAIAALMNESLNSQGIQAKVSLRDGHLWIMLESDQAPDQNWMMSFIRSGIGKLEIPDVKVVKVYGRQLGDMMPAWRQEWQVPQTSRLASVKSSTKANSVPVPLTEPTPSQLRLASLLRVLTLVTLLVTAGSLFQAIQQWIVYGNVLQNLDQWQDLTMFIPLLGRTIISLGMTAVAIVALITLFRRPAVKLHPKHAQLAYARLGAAFLLNVGVAFLLMLAINLNWITPQPWLILPLFALCIGCWIWGCFTLARAKGYNKIFGLVGILLIDGVVLLSLLPDRWLIRRPAQ